MAGWFDWLNNGPGGMPQQGQIAPAPQPPMPPQTPMMNPAMQGQPWAQQQGQMAPGQGQMNPAMMQQMNMMRAAGGQPGMPGAGMQGPPRPMGAPPMPGGTGPNPAMGAPPAPGAPASVGAPPGAMIGGVPGSAGMTQDPQAALANMLRQSQLSQSLSAPGGGGGSLMSLLSQLLGQQRNPYS